MVLIILTSGNFEREFMSTDAYEEACLQMSTGDNATHKAITYICPEEYAPTYLETDEYGNFFPVKSGNEVWNPSNVGGK